MINSHVNWNIDLIYFLYFCLWLPSPCMDDALKYGSIIVVKQIQIDSRDSQEYNLLERVSLFVETVWLSFDLIDFFSFRLWLLDHCLDDGLHNNGSIIAVEQIQILYRDSQEHKLY